LRATARNDVLWTALRYVELNPVRAGMVATTHCGVASLDPMLEMERWRKRWTVAEWREFIADAESAAEVTGLRHSTHTGGLAHPFQFIKWRSPRLRLPLDKNEGAVKDKNILSVLLAPFLCQKG
jgi:hypothetical protein